MLTRVEIKGYRGFEQFKLNGLVRVNLLVGKNNTGKTALLEGVHFLASGGSPFVLVGVTQRRGEVRPGTPDGPSLLDFSHFFYGHDVRPGLKFAVSNGQQAPKVEVEAVDLGEIEPQPELFGAIRTLRPAMGLRITGGRARSKSDRVFVLSEEGAWLVDPRRPRPRYFDEDGNDEIPIVFISPESIGPDSLGSMWNRVLLEKREAEVRSAMGILENTLEDIVFLTGDYTRRLPLTKAGVFIGFSGDKRRVPLGSMGDGMRRLLALSMSLVCSKSGFLLIDEIDTGLHYSVMTQMWELVVKTAIESNIQVFATTHSADCVRGLGALCALQPTLREHVAVHKIERGFEHNFAFTGEDIENAVRQDIELR